MRRSQTDGKDRTFTHIPLRFHLSIQSEDRTKRIPS